MFIQVVRCNDIYAAAQVVSIVGRDNIVLSRGSLSSHGADIIIENKSVSEDFYARSLERAKVRCDVYSSDGALI